MRRILIDTLAAAAQVAQENGAIDKMMDSIPMFARAMIAPHLGKISEDTIRRALENTITDDFAKSVYERVGVNESKHTT